jgi:hypothetical protein
MPWDPTKCTRGVPNPFTNADATNIVTNANFAAATYVNISAHSATTKQAYTFVRFGGYDICLVGHVHMDAAGNWTIAGNCFIPGWQNWQMNLPNAHIAVIAGLATGGVFPGNDRYPHP